MALHPMLIQNAFGVLQTVNCGFFHPICSSFTGLKPYQVDCFSLLSGQKKDKVVFVLGATGSGKSKLSIALAKRFNGEIINSDKMQVYDGLNVITNKVTEEECAEVPHHLLGGVHPDADFSASDFRREAMKAVESIVSRGKLPIIAGGSNSYIQELVEGGDGEFRSQYDCCFLWVDVELVVLYEFVELRVDKMVEQGLLEEARGMFMQDGDYSRGIRRSIGVPEMDSYFRKEGSADEATKARLLKSCIDEIKANTCKLIWRQLQKILRFCTKGWDVRRIDCTNFFLQLGKGDQEELWEMVVGGPCTEIVRNFLEKKKLDITVDNAGKTSPEVEVDGNNRTVLEKTKVNRGSKK